MVIAMASTCVASGQYLTPPGEVRKILLLYSCSGNAKTSEKLTYFDPGQQFETTISTVLR